MAQATLMTGGCLCGAIRYEVDSPALSAGHCHCANCRKHTGAGFATDAMFPARALRWIGAEPQYYMSSEECGRGFCPRCGSTIAARYTGKPEIVIISAGSLDDPNLIAPTHHGYASRRIGWVMLADGLPAYPEDIPGFEPENRQAPASG